MSTDKEIRSNSGSLEIRTNLDGSRSVSGIAIVYNSLSEDLNGFREKVAPGAVSLKNDTRMLFNHDWANVLGRESANTLSLTDTPQGVRFVCKLPNTQVAADLAESISRGDISGMSWGFRCLRDAWENLDGQLIRTILEAECYEISAVASPAYSDASISLRSLPETLRPLLKHNKITKRSNSVGCDCSCSECEDDNCSECSMSDCTDAECRTNGCPAQDEERSLVVEPEDLARYMRLQLAIRK